MPIYARHGVKHLWLINPMEKFMDVFALASEGWLLTDSFAENDKARAEPFREAEIDLAELWLE